MGRRACALAMLLSAACGSGPTLAPAPGPAVGVRVDSETVFLPRPRVFHHDGRVAVQYDAAADSTTVSIVTHPGRYYLWIQHPRITVSFRYAGHNLVHPPEFVLVEVRVQHPQQPRVAEFSLSGSDGTQFAVTPLFYHGSEDVMVTNLDYGFRVPLPTFAHLIRTESIYLRLGGISATFDGGQMEALRDLASRMAPSAK